jgi:hypothetical protein
VDITRLLAYESLKIFFEPNGDLELEVRYALCVIVAQRLSKYKGDFTSDTKKERGRICRGSMKM